MLLIQQSASGGEEALSEYKDRSSWSVEEMRFVYSHKQPVYIPGQRMRIAMSVMEGHRCV